MEGWENNGFLEQIREMVNSTLKKKHDFRTSLEKGICLDVLGDRVLVF